MKLYNILRGPRARWMPVIVTDLGKTSVTYLGAAIPIQGGPYPPIDLHRETRANFDAYFEEDPRTPIAKIAAIYKEHAATRGVSEAAQDVLARLLDHTPGEKTMALVKTNDKTAPAPKEPKTAKAPAAKEPKAAKTPASAPTKEPKAAKTSAPKAEVTPKEKKPAASALFMELIMEGKLTDDAIFAQVQKTFGLDDGKRSYVSWYRNKLKKDGKNPPDALAPDALAPAAKTEKSAKAPKKAA